MQTFEYYTGDTLRCFHIFMETLKSSDPIGSESIKASCFSLCSSINNLLEYLYIERKDAIQGEFGVSSKNEFIRNLTKETYDFIEYKVAGSVLKLVIDVGNASKHKELDRNSPIITDISQVKECLLLLVFEDADGQYLAVDRGVSVQVDLHSLQNLEAFAVLSLEVVTTLLVRFGVIDKAPEIKERYRSFFYTREMAARTFTRSSDIVVIPQYSQTWQSNDPPILIQIFDALYPLKIRNKLKDDAVNFSLSVPIRVAKNPLLNRSRS